MNGYRTLSYALDKAEITLAIVVDLQLWSGGKVLKCGFSNKSSSISINSDLKLSLHSEYLQQLKGNKTFASCLNII